MLASRVSSVSSRVAHARRRSARRHTVSIVLSGIVLVGRPFAMSGVSKLGAYGATTTIISAAGLPFPALSFAVAVTI
ncbi:MAG: hypothetical protein ACTHLY_07520 [Pseudolabrys sp.]